MPQQQPQTEEDILKQYGGTLSDKQVTDLLSQYGASLEPGTIADPRLFENPANRYTETTPTGIAVYQAAPVLPETERPKPQPPPEGTFLHEAFVVPGKQLASGFMSGAAGASHLTANIADLLDVAADKIAQLTGTQKGGLFKHIKDWATAGELAQQKSAAELSEGRQDLASQLYRTTAQAATSTPTYGVATALGGPVGGMAALGALETEDQGWKNMLMGAATGAATGGALHVMGPAGRPIRIMGAAAMTYAQLRLAGVDHQTALAQALTMGGMAGLGPGGGPGLREMAGNIPTPWLPSVANVLTPEERANQAWLTARGIQTPLSMQTGSKAAAALEGTTQNLPGGGRFAETMKAQKEILTGPVARELLQGVHPESLTPEESGAAVQQTIGRGLEQTRTGLAEEVAPGGTVTPEAAGTKVLDAGKAAIRQKHQLANESYQAAWQAERDPRNIERVATGETDAQGNPVTENMALPIDMGPVQAALKPLLARYEYALTQTERANSPGVNIMRQIVGGRRYKPASAAELDLGMLKEAARTEKGLKELRDVSQGLAARAVEELQGEIDAKVGSAEHPDGPGAALDHLRAGRKATAEKHDIEDVFRPFGPNIEAVEPVGAYRRMIWEGDAGIRHLREVADIAPDAMPAVGRAFIEGGGNWKSLGPETKKVLFRDPNVIEGLDQYYAKQEKLGPLLKLEPVALFDRMTARGGTHINLMQDIAEAAPEQKAQIMRTFVEGLLDRVTREGDIQKVQSTLDKWLELDPKTKATLAGTSQRVRDFDNLFFGLKRIVRNPNPSGSGLLGALNQMKGQVFKGLGTIAGAAGGGAHGGYPGGGVAAGAGYLAGAGAEYGTNAALARLLFNQKFIDMLNRGVRAANQGDSAGARLSVRSIEKLLAAEQGEPPQEPPEGPGGPTEPPEGPGGAPAGGGPEGPGGTPPRPFEGAGAGPAQGQAGGAAPAETPGLGQRIQVLLKRLGEEEGSLTLPKLRKADRAAGSEQSTRVPTAVKATEDPLSSVLTTGYQSWIRDPEMLRKNVNAMLDYPNFRDLQAQVKSGALSIPDAAEHIIGRIQENLQWLHDAMPENFRERARLWYDGVHTIARKWAGDYGTTPEQVAASMAVTSPGTDWFVNAERARRLLEFWQDRGSKAWDSRMEATWRDKLSKAVPEQASDQIYKLIKGKSFNRVANDPDIAAIWFRLYDEAVNPREYHTLTPEGKAGDLARIESGDPRQFSWSDFGQIRKGLSILEDGSRENIHKNLGQEHKVRNFYNNIINPDSAREHTTIDTHAVAAGLVRPLSQKSTEVSHNFGGTGSSSSSVSGESGTYALHKEAYRRAAAANDLLPRELQSITWEAIRSMFSPQFKRNPANVEYINSLWQDVSSGKITADAARRRALQYAGGFDRPEWFKGRWNPASPKAAKPSSKSR